MALRCVCVFKALRKDCDSVGAAAVLLYPCSLMV